MKAAFLYADDGLVAPTDLGWLQSAFDTLTGLFDRVGLRKNVRKTVGIVCQPFRTDRVQEEEAYTQRTAGEGQSYKERQLERVLSLECGRDLERGSLVAHRQTQNGV